jgi:hypothetical protein
VRRKRQRGEGHPPGATRAPDRFRAELASYPTAAERAELEAMVERHTDEEVAQLAAMLR